MSEKLSELKDRVNQFRSLQLPGQPMSMHMGTAYLVNDLWEAVNKLRTDLVAEKNRSVPYAVLVNANALLESANAELLAGLEKIVERGYLRGTPLSIQDETRALIAKYGEMK